MCECDSTAFQKRLEATPAATGINRTTQPNPLQASEYCANIAFTSQLYGVVCCYFVVSSSPMGCITLAAQLMSHTPYRDPRCTIRYRAAYWKWQKQKIKTEMIETTWAHLKRTLTALLPRKDRPTPLGEDGEQLHFLLRVRHTGGGACLSWQNFHSSKLVMVELSWWNERWTGKAKAQRQCTQLATQSTRQQRNRRAIILQHLPGLMINVCEGICN